jgi:chorismate mutase
MSKPPPAPPSLAELRKEIDAIDEQVHRLLMARGDIIDRLIQVKQTQEVGSAFRPAREASMMRQLVERHRGILPLDTIESIWRVIISTLRMCKRRSRCMPSVRRRIRGAGLGAVSFRLHRPLRLAFQRRAAVEAVAKSRGDLALVSAVSARTPWWNELKPTARRRSSRAALPRARRPSGCAAVFVISRVADDAMVTEVQMWSVRVSGWNADIARALAPLAEILAVPDAAFDGAALLVSVAGGGFEKIKLALLKAGPRCARRPSSAATQRAIRCLQTGPPGPDARLPEPKMNRPVPNPGILDIAPYTPGKSPVPEPGRKVFKLSANETPFGPSPKAIAVYKEAAAHLEDYPEGTSRVLREAIGRAYGLDPDRIICGAGSGRDPQSARATPI